MSFWDNLGNLLQKGQSAMTGATLGLMRDFGNDPEWAKNIAPEARTLGAGARAGLEHAIKPDQVLTPKLGNKFLDDIIGGAENVFYDPLMLAGGLGAGAGEGIKGVEGTTKLSGLLDKAFSAGRTEGVGRASLQNLGELGLRGGRRIYQGTLATEDNNALEGAQAGLLLGGAEGVGSRLAPKLAPAKDAAVSKLMKFFAPIEEGGSKAAGEAVGEALGQQAAARTPNVADNLSDVLMSRAPRNFDEIAGNQSNIMDLLGEQTGKYVPSTPTQASLFDTGTQAVPTTELSPMQPFTSSGTLEEMMKNDPRAAQYRGAVRRNIAAKLLREMAARG